MPQPRERLADALLHLHRAAHEAVVLERGESLVGHEFELRDGVRAGVLLEHAEMRRVAQLELAGRGLLFGGGAAAREGRQRGGGCGLLKKRATVVHFVVPVEGRALESAAIVCDSWGGV